MGRIKDVFVDVERKKSRPGIERENRNFTNNYQVATTVREGPSNKSTSRNRMSTDGGLPVNITLPNANNYKLTNDDMSGFYTHKNSLIKGEPVPIMQNNKLIQYQKNYPM